MLSIRGFGALGAITLERERVLERESHVAVQYDRVQQRRLRTRPASRGQRRPRRRRPRTRSPSTAGAARRRLGRRRPALPRFRRRHRHAQRRPRASASRRGDRRAGRATHARVLSSREYEPYVAVAEALEPARAGLVAEENAAALDRRRGDRERGEDRARIYAPPGRYRVSARVPRAHAARALDDREERAVQTAFRTVLQRDLPRAVSVRTPRHHDRARAARARGDFRRHRLPPIASPQFIFEPVLGEGGFVPAPRRVRARASRASRSERGIVLSPTRFKPDSGAPARSLRASSTASSRICVTVAKSLAGGLPLAAVTGKAGDHGRARAGRTRWNVRRQSGRLRGGARDVRHHRRRVSRRALARSARGSTHALHALQARLRADRRRSRPRRDGRDGTGDGRAARSSKRRASAACC